MNKTLKQHFSTRVLFFGILLITTMAFSAAADEVKILYGFGWGRHANYYQANFTATSFLHLSLDQAVRNLQAQNPDKKVVELSRRETRMTKYNGRGKWGFWLVNKWGLVRVKIIDLKKPVVGGAGSGAHGGVR